MKGIAQKPFSCVSFDLSIFCRGLTEATVVFQEYRWMDDARDSDFDLSGWTSTF